ncbi:cellulose binding domain-containing protein [Streptomyces sp. NPDC090306]|uniref:cellulose binding domain-containing protein n=1 Tax=Streptomyces sp. NPDC090306 TaxID=3365961 RepID=UPI00380CF868
MVLVLAVLAGAGAVGYPLWKKAHEDKPPLTVQYKAGDAGSRSVSQPWLEVINVSDKRVALADVTMRYWFKEDEGADYAFNCVRAPAGCASVTERIVAMPTPTGTADHYLEVGFTAKAGSLAAGAKGGAVEVQVYRTDGRPVTESGYYSYDAGDSTFKVSRKVTAYLDGALSWGDEPTGASAEAAVNSASSPTPSQAAAPPTAPADTYFDAFHYSGPDDPALRENGWIVRTSKGGPGIENTWTASGVSFPPVKGAKGDQALQLRATTDGTAHGTTQAELQSDSSKFFTGTYAARINFHNDPTSGKNGDEINQAFFMISKDQEKYSELDDEYEPNGGWGSPGPRLDTTTWYSADAGDRVTQQNFIDLGGWHTVVITAAHGTVTYSMDGKKIFTSSGKYYPRESMSANFNTWFVDLPFTGKRTWDMDVNWFYYRSGEAQSAAQVTQQVNSLYGKGQTYVDTVKPLS